MGYPLASVLGVSTIPLLYRGGTLHRYLENLLIDSRLLPSCNLRLPTAQSECTPGRQATMISTIFASLRDLEQSTIVIITSLLIAIVLSITTSRPSTPQLPLVNGPRRWEFLFTNAKKRYYANAKRIIQAGFEKVALPSAIAENRELTGTQSKNGFYVVTENGIELILAPKYAHAIRNDKRFDFHTYRVHVGSAPSRIAPPG